MQLTRIPIRTPAPPGPARTRVRRLPAYGLLVLVALAAGHALPADSSTPPARGGHGATPPKRGAAPDTAAVEEGITIAGVPAGGRHSRSRRSSRHDGPSHADSIRVAEAPPKPFTFAAGRTWRGRAERLEHRGDSRAVLKYLAEVIARESGSERAEARLWRGAFVFRQGLQLRASAVFDSLLDEAPRYSLLLAVPIAENAWRAALATDRPKAAARAVEAWWKAQEQIRLLGLLPRGSESEVMVAHLDSTYARACFDTGLLFLRWNRDREEGRRWVQRAVSIGLEEPFDTTARLELALRAAEDGAVEAAWIEVVGLEEEADLLELPATLRLRLRQTLADLEYASGRYVEARLRYRELLPLMRTTADSQWVMIQAADAARLAAEGAEAHAGYDRYLKAFPGGTWSGWGRAAQADLDSTLAGGEDS